MKGRKVLIGVALRERAKGRQRSDAPSLSPTTRRKRTRRRRKKKKGGGGKDSDK